MGRRNKRGKEKIRSEAPPRPVGFETVLGPGASITGHLSSKSSVRLDGSFEGTLDVGGNILVGEAGKIIADLNAKHISIAGAVRGNVTGERVRILRTGRVWGDIRAYSISAEEGAFIQGQMTTVPEGEPLVPPGPEVSNADAVQPGASLDETPIYPQWSHLPEVEEVQSMPTQDEGQVYFPEPQAEEPLMPEPVQIESQTYSHGSDESESDTTNYEMQDVAEPMPDEPYEAIYQDGSAEGYPDVGGASTQPELPSEADEEVGSGEDELSPTP